MKSIQGNIKPTQTNKKTRQGIIALGVAVVLVFGGTFLANYLHGGKSAGRATAPQARLTFADLETNFPDLSQLPAVEEIGEPKSHDFWIKNDNPTPLPVGVFSETCQCTHVWLYIAPADWKEIPKDADREKAMKDLGALVQPTELKDKDHGDTAVSMPAGAVGVLRLEWKGNRLGAERPGGRAMDGRERPWPPTTISDPDGIHRAATHRAGIRLRRFGAGEIANYSQLSLLVLDAD